MPDYRVKSPVGYAIAEGIREAMRRMREKQTPGGYISPATMAFSQRYGY